ncbi:DUF2064 domain-containing protein [Tenacibaculum jejuense]|uniref:DUF2064 domain-containing protein n=1 Tax=Tenacibaculum jejuense TaxID=584609 RepID=A0A238UEA4_9FLAO|nr:DUF2064 domain-containing protein [Tenacibaculum jejuense]SNR17537.1 conserved protein of unknown function [Tenacibaculum jejuense]
MLNKSTNTAILLFSNTSQKEVKEKQIHNGQLLFKHLHQKALSEAQKTGLDTLVFNENNQKGKTFGERFSNAIETVFNQGYDHVITIGNDSPELNSEHILIAHENLIEHRNTLGPAFDGGVYLIGISKQQFQKDEFASLPWQTSKLLEALSTLFTKENLSPLLLTPLKDVDSKSDLFYFLNTENSVLESIILTIISVFSIPFYTECTSSEAYIKSQHNKGSPLLA